MFTDNRHVRMAITCLAISLLGLLSGCASMYVDGGLKDVNAAQVRKPLHPQDTQVLFAFQTKGTTNAKATELLQAEVMQTIASSGLFAAFGPDPSLSGAILNVTINNVPLTDGAFAKGFVTGLTFGLAGSAVSDGYVCTVDYLPPGGGARITKTSHHAIHTTMGAKGAPPNGIKAKNFEAAARTMTQQIVTAALRDLSQDVVTQ